MQYTTKTYEVERRGTRVRAEVPLRLCCSDPATAFSETCHTVVVNPQGCGVKLSRPLDAGLAVRLEGLPYGFNVNARVASCVALGKDSWLVGLALDETGNVWCIQPAPADWGIAAAPAVAGERTAAVTIKSAKKNEWPYAIFSRRGEAHPGRK